MIEQKKHSYLTQTWQYGTLTNLSFIQWNLTKGKSSKWCMTIWKKETKPRFTSIPNCRNHEIRQSSPIYEVRLFKRSHRANQKRPKSKPSHAERAIHFETCTAAFVLKANDNLYPGFVKYLSWMMDTGIVRKLYSPYYMTDGKLSN